MTNTEELRRYLESSGYKLQYIAEKLGLSYQGFLNKVNNKSEFKPSEINILCDLLDIKNVYEKERIFFGR